MAVEKFVCVELRIRRLSEWPMGMWQHGACVCVSVCVKCEKLYVDKIYVAATAAAAEAEAATAADKCAKRETETEIPQRLATKLLHGFFDATFTNK